MSSAASDSNSSASLSASSSSIKVSVKWNKESFDVEFSSSDGLELFQSMLFSLTNVPVDRQKLMSKGKLLKDDVDLSKLSDGSKLILLGAADELAAAPRQPVIFEEDLTEKQKIQLKAAAPASGLQNLGNTCYLASVLQSFRSVREIRSHLDSFSSRVSRDSDRMAESLSSLMREMDSTNSTVTPYLFTSQFRQSFPQFAERDKEGNFCQQDADEALTQLLQVLIKTGAVDNSDRKENLVEHLFAGSIDSTLRCQESPDEPARRSSESFLKLRCSIGNDVNFLFQGLQKEFDEETERRSELLGRNAIWKKTSKISKLPRLLIVQFVRFFWKKETKTKTKILRKVEFPMKLDMSEFCSTKLKRSLMAARRTLKDEEDEKMGLASINKGKNADAIKAAAKKQLQLQQEKDKEASKVTSGGDELFDESEPMEETLTSGFYDLQSVVTHKGRAADGGHYVGWARKDVKADEWIKYDDETVSSVKNDEILSLSGGGDWHMAYLLIYKRCDDFVGKSLQQNNKNQEQMDNSE